MAQPYNGRCFCGAVEIEASGEPEAMGYCHCASCRSWSASPVNAFSLWQTDRVNVTKGEQHLGRYSKTAFSQRRFCELCGGHVMTEHPTVGLIDVFAATLPDLVFRPQLHVNYTDTVFPNSGRSAEAEGFSNGARRYGGGGSGVGTDPRCRGGRLATPCNFDKGDAASRLPATLEHADPEPRSSMTSQRLSGTGGCHEHHRQGDCRRPRPGR